MGEVPSLEEDPRRDSCIKRREMQLYLFLLYKDNTGRWLLSVSQWEISLENEHTHSLTLDAQLPEQRNNFSHFSHPVDNILV